MKLVIFFLMILFLPGCSYDYYFLIPQKSISKQNEYFEISNEIFFGTKYYDLLSISISLKNNNEKKVVKLAVIPVLLNSLSELKFVKIFDNINGEKLIFNSIEEFNKSNIKKINDIIFIEYEAKHDIIKSKILKLKYRIEFDDGKVFEEELDMVLKKVRDRRSGVLF